MIINLNDATTLKTIAHILMSDNRALGLVSGKILAAVLGGTATGGGNKQVIWHRGGMKHGVGTGLLPKAFIKSSNKGVGRKGHSLKEGDSFMHLSVDMKENTVSVKEYSRSEIEAMV
ncbi:MAG: hypothetical protein ACRCZ2_12530 [Fusobacteriaceae bacterium]